jgi:PTH1 family peptidyl-tRNA hydrolase
MGLIALFRKLFIRNQKTEEPMKKYLIVGLGNIGAKYDNTRHNIGFEVLEELSKDRESVFEADKLGSISTFRYKGRLFILLKPATYMNLSGKAVRYWLNKEKISVENLLVICDDLSLPIGTLRLKSKGGAGGHNGLQNIQDLLGSSVYPRLRFGIGDKFSKGRQVDFVLGEWTDAERKIVNNRMQKATQAILSFGTAGLNNTMNAYNGSLDLKQEKGTKDKKTNED